MEEDPFAELMATVGRMPVPVDRPLPPGSVKVVFGRGNGAVDTEPIPVEPPAGKPELAVNVTVTPEAPLVRMVELTPHGGALDPRDPVNVLVITVAVAVPVDTGLSIELPDTVVMAGRDVELEAVAVIVDTVAPMVPVAKTDCVELETGKGTDAEGAVETLVKVTVGNEETPLSAPVEPAMPPVPEKEVNKIVDNTVKEPDTPLEITVTIVELGSGNGAVWELDNVLRLPVSDSLDEEDAVEAPVPADELSVDGIPVGEVLVKIPVVIVITEPVEIKAVPETVPLPNPVDPAAPDAVELGCGNGAVRVPAEAELLGPPLASVPLLPPALLDRTDVFSAAEELPVPNGAVVTVAFDTVNGGEEGRTDPEIVTVEPPKAVLMKGDCVNDTPVEDRPPSPVLNEIVPPVERLKEPVPLVVGKGAGAVDTGIGSKLVTISAVDTRDPERVEKRVMVITDKLN